MSDQGVNASSELLALASEQPAVALAAIRRLADQGDAGAQFVLAQSLIEGRAIESDPVEAFYWFQLSASAGHALAANMVGRCHELGFGTPVDFERAAAWYRRAVSANLDWSMYNLAHLYATGRGVVLNQGRARELYCRAAGLGHAKSMNMLGRYFEEGIAGEKNEAIAIDWYRRAAQAGDFRGQASIATIELARGNTDAAVDWLEQAVQTGSPAFLRQLAGQLESSNEPRLLVLRSRVVAINDAGADAA